MDAWSGNVSGISQSLMPNATIDCYIDYVHVNDMLSNEIFLIFKKWTTGALWKTVLFVLQRNYDGFTSLYSKRKFVFFHFECLIDRNEEYVLSSLCLKPNTMVCAHMIEWFEKILSTMLKKNKTRIDVGEWLVVRTVTWKTIYALTEMIKMLFTDQTGKTIKIGIWNQQQVLLHEG